MQINRERERGGHWAVMERRGGFFFKDSATVPPRIKGLLESVGLMRNLSFDSNFIP